MKENKENLIQESIDLEKIFFELFRELGLKPAQCQLIRAFLVASNGEIEFEASNTDLAQILHKTNGYDKKANSNVGYAIKVLEKWQQKNKLTLVEIVEKGRKNDDLSKGKAEYHKSKYRFVLLAELAKTYSEKSENLEAVIRDLITELKKKFVPAKEKRKYHPNHNIRKAKKTIFTYLKKIFELAIEADDSPYHRCSKILNECWEILNKLENENVKTEKSDKFITEFEKKLDKSVIENNNEINLIG